MKMNVKFLAVVMFILLAANMSIAYSCEPIIPRRPFRDSKAVFFGELVEYVETDNRCMKVARFKVERYWKGKLSQYVIVQTPSTLCCGYNFAVGGKYLVYAYPEKGVHLETSVGWVLQDDFAVEQMKKLGKGKTLATINAAAISFNSAARQISQHVEKRLIPFPEWSLSDDEEEIPLELIEFKVDGNPVILGQSFYADENWLKNTTLRVKNISTKAIIAFGVGGGLLQGVDEELPHSASFRYGIAWNWGKGFNPEKEKPRGVVLKPGETVELSYAHVDQLTRRVLAKEGEGAFHKLKFMAPSLQYADGTSDIRPGMKFYGERKP